MRTIESQQQNRFALIGAIMVAVSLVFLLYVGTSLYYSGKKFQEQTHSVQLVSK
ncbi:MAG: hypothetical protein H6Q13_2785 [Bacteroidetes bacterium]|jgi:hypothetical protein|nr:hypothetical protein [uncultured Bacteroides sp.]MBP1615337.1 hypothetical protein [Bacteroidota bacterium]